VRWLIIIVMSMLVATCGQKGPLYLPRTGDVVISTSHD